MDTPHGCPVEAISFGEDGKVVINQEKCVGCGICKNHCPMDVIKIDVASYFDFDMDKLTEGAGMRNPDIEIMPLSAKTGEGVQALAQRIIRAVKG